MPKTIIREYDNTKPGNSLYANFSVVVPGLVNPDNREAFDAVKDACVAPQHMEWLTSYCKLGPKIANALDQDERRRELATSIFCNYIAPAYRFWKVGNAEASAAL